MNAIEITGLRKAYPDFELAGLISACRAAA